MFYRVKSIISFTLPLFKTVTIELLEHLENHACVLQGGEHE